MKSLRLSFKQRLLLGISLSIFVVFGVGGFIADRLIQDRLQEQALQQMEDTSRGMQAMVRNLVVSSIKNYLKGVSETNLAYLRQVYGRYAAGEISESRAKALARDFMVGQQVGETGYIVALDCSDPDHPTVAVHPNPSFIGASADKFPFMIDECHLKSGYFEFTLNLPGMKNRPKSMWVSWFEPWKWTLGATPFKSEYPQLTDIDEIDNGLSKVDIPNQSYGFIMDMKGELLSHPTWKGLNMIDAVDLKSGNRFVRQMIDSVEQSRAHGKADNLAGVISFRIKDPRSDRIYSRLMNYRYVPETHWIVGVVTDLDMLMAPLAVIRSIQIIVMALSILISLMVIMWAIRPMTGALEKLSRTVDKIDRGSLDTPMPPSLGNDEIGRLASAFKRMTERLARYTEDLEDLVAERTAKLEEANQKLAALSITDELTGVFNRRRFDEALVSEMARSQRAKQRLALIMIDVDHFKKYNDRYGHQEGDECLKSVARILHMQARRAGDLAARYGGEEFAVILTNTGMVEARGIAEEICRSVEAAAIPHEWSPNKIITVSLGVAVTAPDSIVEATALIRAADQALYRAKDRGRNRVEWAANC